jgi:hypothetical protein
VQRRTTLLLTGGNKTVHCREGSCAMPAHFSDQGRLEYKQKVWKLDECGVIRINIVCNFNFVKRLSSYRAVNTLRLGYENQSVNVV